MGGAKKLAECWPGLCVKSFPVSLPWRLLVRAHAAVEVLMLPLLTTTSTMTMTHDDSSRVKLNYHFDTSSEN